MLTEVREKTFQILLPVSSANAFCLQAPPNHSQRPFPARHQGIGRYYSAGNGLQRRYVTGQSTIAEGAGAKGLTEDYPTLRCGARVFTFSSRPHTRVVAGLTRAAGAG